MKTGGGKGQNENHSLLISSDLIKFKLCYIHGQDHVSNAVSNHGMYSREVMITFLDSREKMSDIHEIFQSLPKDGLY